MELAREWLNDPNPSGKPNSDILRPYFNGKDLAKRPRGAWTVDFGVDMPLETATSYEKPFRYVANHVKPIRAENRREAYAKNWWIYAESRPAMREAFSSRSRFLATCMVAKHRNFVWLDTVSLPANVVIAFGRSDDFFLGLLQSRFHVVWSLKQGTRLETRPRYTPTTCFETFPFPFVNDLRLRKPSAPLEPDDESGWEQVLESRFYTIREEPPAYGGGGARTLTPGAHRAAIAAAAKELNELRERWLNPPEWTVEKFVEFPGSIAGPWARYVVEPDKEGIGTVRYPRLEPRDSDCASKLKKRTLTDLYNERPDWLDFAHKRLDAAVAAAYGWPADLSDEQVLERLLALNLQRAAEEAREPASSKRQGQRGKVEDELV